MFIIGREFRLGSKALGGNEGSPFLRLMSPDGMIPLFYFKEGFAETLSGSGTRYLLDISNPERPSGDPVEILRHDKGAVVEGPEPGNEHVTGRVEIRRIVPERAVLPFIKIAIVPFVEGDLVVIHE